MTEITTQITAWVLALGFALPLLTAIVQRPSWPKQVRVVVAVIAAVLSGLGVWVANYGLDFSSPAAIVSTVLGVIAASQVAYQGIWGPSGVANSIEMATSGPSPRHLAPEESV